VSAQPTARCFDVSFGSLRNIPACPRRRQLSSQAAIGTVNAAQQSAWVGASPQCPGPGTPQMPASRRVRRGTAHRAQHFRGGDRCRRGAGRPHRVSRVFSRSRQTLGDGRARKANEHFQIGGGRHGGHSRLDCRCRKFVPASSSPFARLVRLHNRLFMRRRRPLGCLQSWGAIAAIRPLIARLKRVAPRWHWRSRCGAQSGALAAD
jgi:hypothetical protein